MSIKKSMEQRMEQRNEKDYGEKGKAVGRQEMI